MYLKYDSKFVRISLDPNFARRGRRRPRVLGHSEPGPERDLPAQGPRPAQPHFAQLLDLDDAERVFGSSFGRFLAEDLPRAAVGDVAEDARVVRVRQNRVDRLRGHGEERHAADPGEVAPGPVGDGEGVVGGGLGDDVAVRGGRGGGGGRGAVAVVAAHFAVSKMLFSSFFLRSPFSLFFAGRRGGIGLERLLMRRKRERARQESTRDETAHATGVENPSRLPESDARQSSALCLGHFFFFSFRSSLAFLFSRKESTLPHPASQEPAACTLPRAPSRALPLPSRVRDLADRETEIKERKRASASIGQKKKRRRRSDSLDEQTSIPVFFLASSSSPLPFPCHWPC